jgi:hypothetical protein
MTENIKPKNKPNINPPIHFLDCTENKKVNLAAEEAPSKTGSNGTHRQNTQDQELLANEAEAKRRTRIYTEFTSEKHPVVWVVISRKGRTKYIGVCGKTWKPCFFTDNQWIALIIKDLVTDIDYCQDEDHCLNIFCTINRTTPESLARVKKMGPKDSKWLNKNWEKFTEKFSHYSYLAESCRKEFEATGSAHILRIKSKPKRKREAENHE